MNRDSFRSCFRTLFDHSPWVIEEAWEVAPFESLDQLHGVLTRVIVDASRERQLSLIRAHPDLAGAAAVSGELTTESKSEQAGAGLDTLTARQYDRFQELNEAYKTKFGFPFIVAVKGLSKEDILSSFEQRLENECHTERCRALVEISKIARFRLADLVQG